MKRNNDRGERNNEKKTLQQQLLPEELIIEILLRLPVLSLVRFKCVCKSWLSLISDPLFATSHFNLITATPTHRLILIPPTRPSQTRSIDFQASLNDHTATASLNLHFLPRRSYLTLKIGGSCRGFIFFYCHRDFYLWNPSTGIHKQLPPSHFVSDHTRFVTYLNGFGYDPLADDYLVILGSSDPTTTDVLTHYEFFSLRANTWKEIEFAYLPCVNASDNAGVGTLFNGAIHWLTYRVDTYVNVIVAFDLTQRRILEIPLPDTIKLFNVPINCGLWVFEGHMSLWAMDNDIVEIWVMKEYRVGVCSSWTKTFVLSVNDDTRYFYPICSTSSGDIVGSDSSTGLVKYNANGQLIEHHSYFSPHRRSQVGSSYCNNRHRSQVALYTESLLLLPLPGDT